MEICSTSQSRPHAGIETESSNIFKPFDVVSDHSDHSFVDSAVECHEAYKAIMKEWKFLEQNLPESIFVRVYEGRVDLLRAVIVGAAGTPYYDGLFFFDFLFPSVYPSLPPRVQYLSFGLKLNPNLYESGHVCLSLLDTWRGKGCEKWNPSESSVFQILLSLQALVLNDKPFLNEPMHGFPGGPRLDMESQVYTEGAFALSCQTMIYLSSNPPKNFETFVARHFFRRGSSILMACEAYMHDRVPVGYVGESPSIIKVSAKTRAAMRQLHPRLGEAFRRLGSSIDASTENLTVKKTKSPSIVKKAVAKIRRFLGCKKKTTE